MEYRRTKQFAVVSLVLGLSSLRAALADPVRLGLYTPCQGWQYQKITWRSDLTLDFYTKGCHIPADNAYVVFAIVTACGTVMTLYGAWTLLRHRFDGSQ